MEPAEPLNTLDSLPLGGRLLVRSKRDWRTAVVCRIKEERVVLSIASPSGRNYRMHRDGRAEVVIEGMLCLLKSEFDGDWRQRFSKYDSRW